MPTFSIVASGAVLGLSISAPIGPMGLLCINRTLNDGVWAGVSTGAGAATVQVAYCAILLLGIGEVAPWVSEHRAAFSLLGALVMLYLACRLVAARRTAAARTVPTRRSLAMTYVSAAAFNALNPMLMLLMIGGVATLLDPAARAETDVRLMLAGLFAGSFTWWICLSSVTAALSGRLSLRTMDLIDKLIATVLLGFSALAAARAAGLPL